MSCCVGKDVSANPPWGHMSSVSRLTFSTMAGTAHGADSTATLGRKRVILKGRAVSVEDCEQVGPGQAGL